MTRIAFCNNYSMREARRLVQLGIYPRQHLWGSLHLEDAGYEVDFLPFQSSRLLKHASRVIGPWAGDLEAQLRTLRHPRNTITYAAAEDVVRGAAWLRRRRLWPGRLVGVVHGPSDGQRTSEALRGLDLAIALSRRIRDELVASGRDPAATITLPWGPDLSFRGYRSNGQDFVLSSGKTARDVDTLLRGVQDMRTRVKVHTLNDSVGATSWGHVERVVKAPYASVLADLQRCSVVAIPLLTPRWMVGVTELNDALALAKPVVMTRNPFIDCDIEAIGCGLWVEKNDAEGWRTALTTLASDPALRHEMGRRGRQYAESSWNADLFGAGLVRALRQRWS